MHRIIFVTGTDTGVGKTIVTAFLLHHLRQSGVHAIAMKPFCSGGRGDVKLLQALQKSEFPDDEINPYHFEEPVAPLVACRRRRRVIKLADVVKRIRSVAGKCECLLVEGAGGLLVPLGDDFMVIDLIRRLVADVVLVTRNRLGTINHTLLSARALEAAGIRKFKCALVTGSKPDFSARTNLSLLRELLKPNPVVALPYLGPRLDRAGAIKRNYLRAFCFEVMSRPVAFDRAKNGCKKLLTADVGEIDSATRFDQALRCRVGKR